MVLRIVRKRGNVAHYDEKSGVVHLLIVEGLAHLCWAAEEAWTTIEVTLTLIIGHDVMKSLLLYSNYGTPVRGQLTRH